MKPMPVSCRHVATSSGDRLMWAPNASITSALPEVDDTLRPPCLATRAPAAAATKTDAVEMLNVCELSPPVPTMSTRFVRSTTGTGAANSRMTVAAAVISPIVSFFTRRPIAKAAIITGDISPLMMRRIRASISSWKISRCSMTRVSASVSEIGMAAFSGGRADGAADFGDAAVDAGGIDIEMGDEAKLVQAGAQHAARAQLVDQRLVFAA